MLAKPCLRAVLAALSAFIAHPAHGDAVVVFAASSLKTALDVVAQDFMSQTGHDVVISYAGSNALANQIMQGAQADVFISAASIWMDAIEREGLIAPESRIDLLGNSLVLVAHQAQGAPFELSYGYDLSALLKGEKIAMAMVDAVPAGQYGKQALQNLSLWHKVEAAVVQTENVRAALAFVASGEAPYGIVYSSDAVASRDVTVQARFPKSSHSPIRYPAALIADHADDQDVMFFNFLSSGAAKQIFVQHGFEIPQ